jgi:hypothetical protein
MLSATPLTWKVWAALGCPREPKLKLEAAE